VTLPEAIGILRHARDAGDLTAVEQITATLLTEFPSEQMPLHAAGNTLLALGALERAGSTLEAALALAPRAEIWNDLGVVRQRRGDVLRAIDAYRAALAERPGFTEAAANLAAALFLTGANAEALVHARAAEANAPGAPGLTTTLALMRPANDRAAQLLFGDRRARRLFGADLPAAFEAASLPGRALAHAEVLPGVDGATWGCNPREPLFVYGRQRCPSFRS